MADNAPLTEELFLEIIKGLATKEDFSVIRDATRKDFLDLESKMEWNLLAIQPRMAELADQHFSYW